MDVWMCFLSWNCGWPHGHMIVFFLPPGFIEVYQFSATTTRYVRSQMIWMCESIKVVAFGCRRWINTETVLHTSVTFGEKKEEHTSKTCFCLNRPAFVFKAGRLSVCWACTAHLARHSPRLKAYRIMWSSPLAFKSQTGQPNLKSVYPTPWHA